MKDIRSLYVEKYLLNNGFRIDRYKGDHVIFKKDKKMIVITRPKVNSLIVRNELRKK